MFAHTHTHVPVHRVMHVCTHTHARACTQGYAGMNSVRVRPRAFLLCFLLLHGQAGLRLLHLHIYTRACIKGGACLHTHTHTHTHARTHTHTQAHTHTHTCLHPHPPTCSLAMYSCSVCSACTRANSAACAIWVCLKRSSLLRSCCSNTPWASCCASRRAVCCASSWSCVCVFVCVCFNY